ncbi:MAG: EF-P 5-aminopentanol modification-associated protein YfmF [Oscillospiraceae bacterium]
MIKYDREKIGEGIHFTTIINPCQKTNSLFVRFVTKLSAETAALNAIIPYVLSGSSSEYKTVTELSRKLAGLYGANLRGSVSKMGDSQIVTMSAGCINDRYTFDGEKITGELARVLIGCIMSPNMEDGSFSSGDFLLKKQELLDDIDAEINDKRVFAFKRSSAFIYENEPCAVNAKGEKTYAEKIDSAAAYAQYKELLRTAQIEITFVGADEQNDVKNMFADAFSAMDRAYGGDNRSEFSSVKPDVKKVTERYDVAQSKMVMAFKSDCKNAEAMKLMNSVFGGTPFSKLFMNVREKLSLCYYCSSGYNDKKGVVFVDSGVENANIQKAEDEIINQLGAVCRGEFTDEDMQNSRLAMINALRGVNDGAISISDWYFKQSYSGTALSPEQEIEKLCAVKREDIIEAAKSLKLDTVYVLTGKEDAVNE